MDDLADDLLVGAGPIAEFVLKADTKQNRRRIYYLHEQRRLPTFNWGNEKSQIAAFKSGIRQALTAQAQEALASVNKAKKD
jgi:hypothetical protein